MSPIDLAKRRRIMQRSRRLGHCVCDPRRPCPCDVFTQQGICPCAGERPEPVDLSTIRLTQLVHNAGCASKIAPADLEAVLARLPPANDPAVISGVPAGDDAAIYRLTDDVVLVQTVDVMTPCCDDARTFGRICAANCLSDIYAMGGVPRTALSVLAFPSETLDGRLMYEMLRGAGEVLAAAGVALIGGHSIKDEEIKLGFAVTGTVEAGRLTRHDTAAVGDALVLTKPLGTGVLSFSRQVGRAAGDLAAALESMAALNKPAAEAAAEVGVSACTDVTGFGLFGHLISMARHSGVTAEVWADRLPAFDGAREALREGVVPGAVERNMEYVGADLSVQPGVEEADVQLGFDAQTSGGLLLCVPEERRGDLERALAQRGVRGHAIGRIVERSEGRIVVANRSSNQEQPGEGKPPSDARRGSGPAAEGQARSSHGAAEPCCPPAAAGESAAPGAHSAECCQDPAAAQPAPGIRAAGPSPFGEAFAALMAATGAAGRLDERTKELINFALVVHARCAPCVAAHLKKAQQLGITREELDEAAWCAVAMGGAPVRMFYLEAMRKAQRGEE